MIKDITIGQYFPGNSVIHRMDARIKIIMTAVFIVMLFAANSVWGLLVGIAFTILTLSYRKYRQTHAKKLEAYRADNNIYGDTQSAFLSERAKLILSGNFSR